MLRCSHCSCPLFTLCGQCLPLVASVVHLGNTLQYDHEHDKLDIQLKSMTFIHQANSVLFQFNGCDPATKMTLFKAAFHCMAAHCGAHGLQAHNVSFNNLISWIWKLSYNCHTSIAHSVGLTTSIYNIIYSRFIRLLSMLHYHNHLDSFVLYFMTSHACNSSFVGYNCMYCNLMRSETLILSFRILLILNVLHCYLSLHHVTMYLCSFCLCSLHLHWCVFNNNKLTLLQHRT